MFKKIRNRMRTCLHGESGQALVTVLVLLVIGSLTLPPVLSHLATALRTERIYRDKADELYAADSGIEDAIWQIKYDRLQAIFTDPLYDPYDYSTVYSYTMEEPVNGLTPDITIQNIWIPKDAGPLSPSEARAIAEGNKLMVAGTAIDGANYKIKINFLPAEGEEDDLIVQTIGIWLPLGFTYNMGSSNLEENPLDPYYSVPTVEPHAGGEAVIWEFESVPFTSFPGVNPMEEPMMTEITFQYTASKPDTTPVAIAWMVVTGVPDLPMSWDIDTRIFRITSTVNNTQIEAYSAKCELRKMGSAISGDYYAVGDSLMIDTNHDWHGVRDLLLSSSYREIDAIPASAQVIAAYLYWSGWKNGQSIFSDTCTNFNNWDRGDLSQTRVPTADGDISGTWNPYPSNPSTRWDKVDETTPNDADYMTGTTDSGGYMLFSFSPFSVPPGSTIIDLTVYVRAKDVSSGTNNIRPSIKVYGTRYNTTATSNNPGTSFTTYSYSYTTNPSTGAAWTVADINGTGSRPLQQFGVYSSDLNPDIQISMVYAEVHYFADTSRWSINSDRFQGQGTSSATTEQRTITMKNSVDLSSYASGTVRAYWNQTKSGTLESGDALYYAFYNSSGWSSDFVAFQGNSTPTNPITVVIPDAYLTSNFKMRFYFNFNDTAEYVYLDNIKLLAYTPDTSVVFKINDVQVYLDENGEPQQGAQELTAGEAETLENQPGEYSYACHRDVTRLVKAYSDLGEGENRTGNGKYEVGGVDGDTGSEWSYAGWSLVIIYSSPETAGHMLYLWDTFAFNHGNENLDFDNDGQPGGDIKGFFIPEPIQGETIAATLTVFVGEGDNCYTGDYLRFNGTNLSDGYSTSNVWNGRSIGMNEDGVDVDTFYITWASNLLEPGDTTAHIDLPSGTDNWNLIYIILSMRSETTTGGTVHYVIRHN